MATYISMLRGINVSGQKIIKMEALRGLYEGLGFTEVKTYVQSGNVVFRTEETDVTEMANKIAGHIARDFGFEVPVLVLSAASIRGVAEGNPWLADGTKDAAFLHVTFLSSMPSSIDISAIEAKKMEGEEIAIREGVVYLYCPHGYGKTKLTNSFLETKLRTCATTRNWKTVCELSRMSQEIAFVQ